MRDPELVARAQRAAAYLESAWEQRRALHGLAVAPGRPVVSYVGYSFKKSWGQPGSSSGSTPTRPSSSPISSAMTNAHSAGRPASVSTAPASSTAPGGRQSPDQARDMAAELASWSSGELPAQGFEQLASWPSGLPSGADQPLGRAQRHPATPRPRSPAAAQPRSHRTRSPAATGLGKCI